MSRDTNTWGLVRDARAPLIGRDEEMRALDAALEIVETEPVGTADTSVQ